MKEVLLFVMAGCPYCREALQWQEDLMEKEPAFRSIPLRIIDETKEPDFANRFDYYYVPTYYVDGKKLHEGAATEKIVEDVLKTALQNE
ncbi:MAG: thioredoxin family protein [Candidatus Merdivicinus sp.]